MGELEGLQLLEYFIVLGKPPNEFFDKYSKNLSSEVINGLKQIREMIPYDIIKLLDPDHFYEVI